MNIVFLGTGTSQGVPVIGCDCLVCQSTNEKDKRLRSSVLIQTKHNTIVIDTGPDFRQQMLRANPKRLDAVLFTHEHKDHVAGLDDIRAFNFKQQCDMPLYASQRVCEAIRREFHYAFSENPYPGIPKLTLKTIDQNPFKIDDLSITPIDVLHHKLPVKGFRISDFTYITDAKHIPPKEKEKIKGSKILVLNALRKKEHLSHFTLQEALDLANELDIETTYLTHISHYLGKHEDVQKELPQNVKLAFDGLTLTL